MPTVPGAVGDNSMQTANIVSTTSSMSRRFENQPCIEDIPSNGLKDTSGVLAVEMDKVNLKITPKG